jgi:hypothetical protein
MAINSMELERERTKCGGGGEWDTVICRRMEEMQQDTRGTHNRMQEVQHDVESTHKKMREVQQNVESTHNGM